MLIQDKIYTFLCALFAVIVTIGNMIYQKFIILPIPYLHTFEISAGVLFYPFTFLITDLIAEFYGREKAKTCVKIGILLSMVAASIIFIADMLNATLWSKIDNSAFHQMFGVYHIAFFGSLLAAYISQNIDIKLYLWIKKITHGKYLGLRNNISTSISLLIDTSIVIGFMTYFGALPFEIMFSLILNSYTFKLLITLCSTPVFYLSVRGIKKLIK